LDTKSGTKSIFVNLVTLYAKHHFYGMM
jgi:TPR repeat protein